MYFFYAMYVKYSKEGWNGTQQPHQGRQVLEERRYFNWELLPINKIEHQSQIIDTRPMRHECTQAFVGLLETMYIRAIR
jgi:hypothetical protein